MCFIGLLPIWLFAQSSPKVSIDTQITEVDKLLQVIKGQNLFAIAVDKAQADFNLTIASTVLRDESNEFIVYLWNLYDNSTRTVIASGGELSPMDCLPKVASAVRTGWQARQQLGPGKSSVGGVSGSPDKRGLPKSESGKGIETAPGTHVDLYAKGNGVTEPIPSYNPRPNYTEEARNARIEGVIVLQAIIRKDGSVDSFKVIKGLGHGLDEITINTIATKWKFKPGTLKGVPVDVLANIEVTFKLYGKRL